MANYVKFYRGTPAAYNATSKDKDTLYFITESGSSRGTLYLGNTIISKDISSFEDFENILISSLSNNQLLVYNSTIEKWENKAITDIIGVMKGASDFTTGTIGLVPAPQIGDQTKFLRGDGTWVEIINGENGSNITVDGKTISLLDDGMTIALKDFGKKYYKYISKTEEHEAYYQEQVVDALHPWKENLEARVTVDENGHFVLGWFEKDLSNIEQIQIINSSIANLENLLNKKPNSTEVYTKIEINSKVTDLTTLLNQKIDSKDVYTKAEVDAKILAAEHLIRKTFISYK